MVYVDYTQTIDVESSVGDYIGAGNFARGAIELLNDKDIDYRLICYREFKPKEGKETAIFENKGKIYKTDSVSSVVFENGDILFVPVANGYFLNRLVAIKKEYPFLKVCVVIHDKQHNFTQFDPMDTVYNKGLLHFAPILYLKYIFKHSVYNLMYPFWVKSIDRIITVSNYSMQVLGHRNVARITYIGSGLEREDDIVYDEPKERENYLLFVSGARPEKNLARTLQAYYVYCKDGNRDKNKLYITGINNDILKRIAKNLKIPSAFIKKYIRIYGYVSTKELYQLYRNCRYLLFTSKAEGYGLPVLEVMKQGKTVLASRQTSIPEVGGSALYYVDAYNARSILNGMRYLDNDEKLAYRESLVKKKVAIIDEQIKLDKEILIHEILGD